MVKKRTCYDNGKYNTFYYGRKANTYEGGNLYYGVCPAGIEVRRDIGQNFIYRVQTGNGYHGSKLGKKYQHKYNYFIPGSISNIESEPYRKQWIAAVEKWQYDLTAAQKEEYNRRANLGLHMSGYNLFMREAMLGKVQMFVDRGDPASYDYVKTDLTTDGAWHDLDLSAIAPAGAKAILLRVIITDDSAFSTFAMQKKGISNDYNQDIRLTRVANLLRQCTFTVACDKNRFVQYRATDTVWTTINIVIRGWWT